MYEHDLLALLCCALEHIRCSSCKGFLHTHEGNLLTKKFAHTRVLLLTLELPWDGLWPRMNMISPFLFSPKTWILSSFEDYFCIYTGVTTASIWLFLGSQLWRAHMDNWTSCLGVCVMGFPCWTGKRIKRIILPVWMGNIQPDVWLNKKEGDGQ